MIGDGAKIVEELAQNVPSALAFHNRGAEQVVAKLLDRFPQQESCLAKPNVAEALILGSPRPVGGRCCRGKPTLVYPSAVGSKRVEIV